MKEIKIPKRLKSPQDKAKAQQDKKALIYARQYAYVGRKTALYQEKLFYAHGIEISIINSLQALSMTVVKFNKQYQDTLTEKHALLLLYIKHYVTTHSLQSFNPEDLRTFYNLQPLLGNYYNQPRPFRVIMSDLNRLDFINPLGKGKDYMPTTRIKVFTTMFEHTLADLFKSAQ